MLEKEDEIDISKSSRVPVAYIGDTKYFTLDAALDAAYNNGKEDKIYVIPNLAHSLYIQKSHIIEKGDSFLLPYEGETCLNEAGNNGTGFADNNTSNRKTQVILKEQETLTIESGATMTIGAITGSGSNPQGQASSSYCELTMGMNSTLSVKGNLNCYGFIKESRSGSNILVNDGGTLTTPVSFYDHSSFITSSSYTGKNIFPYNQFDIPSIRPNMIFSYGSTLFGRVHLYGSSFGDATTSAKLIAPDGAFINMLDKNAKVEWKFADSSSNASTSKEFANHKTSISYSGNGSFGSLLVNISGTNVDSKNYYLPVPCGYSVFIKSGADFSIPSSIKGVKFMPGSLLDNENSAKLTFDSNVIFYQNTTADDGMTTFKYPVTDSARLINKGKLYINADFDGIIESDSSKEEDASVSFGWLYKQATDCQEVTGKQGYTLTVNTFKWGGAAWMTENSSGELVKTNFEAGWIYQSLKTESSWEKVEELPKDITSASITSASNPEYAGNNGSEVRSGVGKNGGFDLTVTPEPNDYDSTDVSYSWKVSESTSGDTSGAHLQSKTGQTVTLLTDANSGNTDITYTIEATVSFTKVDGTKESVSEKIEIVAVADSCILPTSLILMADGSYKEAGLIRHGDMVIAFNHETGRLEPTQVIVNEHIEEDANERNVLHLTFDDGDRTDLIYMHGYFDLTLNKYVYLSIDNYSEYIGHEFVHVDSKLNRAKAKLISGEIIKMYTKVVSPVTANHLNIIADNLLSITACVDGLFNIFEYDSSTLAFDKEKMQRDIDKYGLLGYEAFEQYFPEKIYDLLPCKYLSVSIGKGLITWKTIEQYIGKWKDQLLENM